MLRVALKQVRLQPVTDFQVADARSGNREGSADNQTNGGKNPRLASMWK